jgi:3-dehydroquinate synthetase
MSSRIAIEGNRFELAASRQIEYQILHPELTVFDPAERSLVELLGTRPLLIVSDVNVAPLYSHAWRRYAQQHLRLAGEIILQAGEACKTFQQVEEICAAALRVGIPRDGVVVGIGGGIVLDTAGFAAAMFRRGIDFVRIPTTLVGLVDVAVGIKQGVNAFGKKNVIGAFHPPLASVNDYRFLKTLALRDISCGLAEILKMALLRDPALFELLEGHGAELLSTRLAEPAQAAREVCRRAELLMLQELAPNLFEENLARLVDFGHTFSPAIETASNFEIPHGHAVALDMMLSTALANPALLPRLNALYAHLELPCWDARIPSAPELLHALAEIRQHRGGALNLVVVPRPGEPRFVNSVSRTELTRALAVLKQYGTAFYGPANFVAGSVQITYDRAAL